MPQEKEAGNTKRIAPDDRDDGDSDDFKLHAMHSKASPPIMVNLDLEGRSLSMELDTGAAFSVISELTYNTQ